jgi:hypothetical protein
MLALSPLILSAQKPLSAKQAARENAVTEMIEGKKYTFVVNTIIPLRGESRQTTSSYDLRVAGDSVISDLPYFGRAYAAPIGGGGGFNFVSTKNIYTITPRKKGGWDILIRPDRQTDVREFRLTIFGNGSGSLQVTSNNRDPISFNGYISEKR